MIAETLKIYLYEIRKLVSYGRDVITNGRATAPLHISAWFHDKQSMMRADEIDTCMWASVAALPLRKQIFFTWALFLQSPAIYTNGANLLMSVLPLNAVLSSHLDGTQICGLLSVIAQKENLRPCLWFPFLSVECGYEKQPCSIEENDLNMLSVNYKRVILSMVHYIVSISQNRDSIVDYKSVSGYNYSYPLKDESVHQYAADNYKRSGKVRSIGNPRLLSQALTLQKMQEILMSHGYSRQLPALIWITEMYRTQLLIQQSNNNPLRLIRKKYELLRMMNSAAIFSDCLPSTN